MDKEAMKRRTKEFTLRCLRLCRALPWTVKAQAVRGQLCRCGGSVGANYRAALRARSKAEFRAKLGIVEEEADECLFWLEVIMEDGMLPAARVQPLHEAGNAILSIVVSTIRSSRD